jgi:hypothetical protein
MGITYSTGEVDANGAQEVTIKNSAGTELAINSDGSLRTNTLVTSLANLGQVFGVNLELNLPSTGEQNMLLLRNPAGSGKNILINMSLFGSVDTITRYRIRIYQKPTITSVGNSFSVFPCLVKASNPPVSVALAYSSPVTSSRGTRIRTYAREGTNSDVEYTDRTIDMTAGTDILVTGDTDATNKILAITLQWSEEV